MEHVRTQRTESWVVLLETGSLKVSPALEGSRGHHPSYLEAPSVGLPDRKKEGPTPHPQAAGGGEGGRAVPMATNGEALFSSRRTFVTMELFSKENGLLGKRAEVWLWAGPPHLSGQL